MRVPYSSSTTRINIFFESLNEHLQSGTFCDVTFRAGCGSFPCHRIIVASYSPYFQALLSHQFRENQQETIVLTNVESHIFSLLLQYMYSGKIEIDEEYVHDLLIASDMFQLDEVLQFCCHYLSISLNEKSVIDTWKIANDFECNSLKSDAENYMLTHFRELIKLDVVKYLPQKVLIQMISDDDLIVDNEQQVLEAILMWHLHNREQSFKPLFDNVRFDFISKEHQTKILYELGLNNPNLVKRIEQLIDNREISANNNQIRRGMRKTCYIFGGCSLSTENSVNYLLTSSYRCEFEIKDDPSSMYSIELKMIDGDQMKYPRMHHQSAGLGSLIYVVGGEDGDNIFNSVEVFDPSTKKADQQWTSTSSMIMPRCNFGLVSVDNTSLYALGGHVGADITSTIEKFDSQTNLWTLLPYRLKLPCYGFACVLLNGMIVCLGGLCIFSLPVKTTEIFNPRTGQSYFCTDMYEARSFPSACVDEEHEKIYVFGGADANGNALRTVEVYHGYHCRWYQLPSMFFNRISPCIYRLGHLIVVFGGRTSLTTPSEILNSAEMFDTEKNIWTRLGDLPIRLYGASSTVR